MRSLFVLFLVVIIFPPLAFGAVEEWSLAVMESLALLCLAAFLYLQKKGGEPQYYKTPGMLPLGCLLGYTLLQLTPLPAELVRLASPEAFNIYTNASGSAAAPAWIPLSVHPRATLAEFMRLASYAAVYILTVQLLADRRRLKQTVVVVTIFAAVLALFSILQQFTPNGRIYWMREVSTKLFYGPFANRNHYAGLMNMLFPVALALFLALRPRISYTSFREKMSDFLERLDIGNHILAGLAAVIIATSIILALSRGGIITFFLSLLFMGLLLLKGRGRKKRAYAVLLIGLLITVVIGWFGWERVISRFDDLKDSASIVRVHSVDRPDRMEMWKDGLAAAGDFILTGSGMGGFISVYPKYRGKWTDYTIDHAHDDYIELLVNGGVISLLLAVWLLFSVLYSSYKSLRLRKDGYSIHLFIGCLTGLFSVLVFSLFDFNLQIGSNGLYFFFLLGLAVSAANTRLHRGTEPTYLVKAGPPKALRVVAPALLLFCCLFHAGVIAGAVSFRPAANHKPAQVKDLDLAAEIKASALRASMFDPLEAKYYYTAGMMERRLTGNNGGGGELFRTAAGLDPLNGEYLQAYGRALHYMGREEDADRLIRAGALHDVANPARHKFYAVHLFMTGRKAEAAETIKKALSAAPDRAEDFLMLMMLRGMSDETIHETLPARPAPHISFAEYLAKKGKPEAADNAYREALLLASKEQKSLREYFVKASDHYLKRGRTDAALAAIKMGLEKLPDDGELHFRAAAIYEQTGMYSAAIEEYRKTASLDTSRSDAYRKMQDLIRKTGKP
jgi:O-antigen ligase/tetratricopeptide (TPR) repeat protein